MLGGEGIVEGIFINASNCEVCYNTFINSTGPANWVGNNGECDGGATEVSVASGRTIEVFTFITISPTTAAASLKALRSLVMRAKGCLSWAIIY